MAVRLSVVIAGTLLGSSSAAGPGRPLLRSGKSPLALFAPQFMRAIPVFIVEEGRTPRAISAAIRRRHPSAEWLHVLSSCIGSEALNLSRSSSDKIDLLVTDLQMGVGMNGIELGEQIP